MSLDDYSLEQLRAEVDRRERAESWVGVACYHGDCGTGGVFPEDGSHGPPVDDDGREFRFLDGEWVCATHAEELERGLLR